MCETTKKTTIDTLLFDLDGTLVPYWQDAYLSAYLQSVAAVFAAAGYDPKAAVKALMESSYMMIRNDGSHTNRDVFFQDFTARLGEGAAELEPALETYYRTDFSVVKSVFGEQRDLKDMLAALREKGYTLVIATNPLFPLCAIEARLSWVGLSAADFDHITVYDNSRFCKPNLDYYRDLLRTLDRPASRCMMIGNNIAEDMIAGEIGISTYLVRDYLENPKNLDPNAFAGGSFSDLAAMLAALPSLK